MKIKPIRADVQTKFISLHQKNNNIKEFAITLCTLQTLVRASL